MLNIMLTLVPIFGIMLLGAWAESRRILHKDTAIIINQFVYYFSLPILLFNIISQVDVGDISWRPIVAFLIGTGFSQILITCIARIKGKSKQESIAAGLMASFPNAAFMGLPVVMLVFPNNLEAEIYAGIAALLPTFLLIYTDTSLSIQNAKRQNLSATVIYICKTIARSPQFLGAGLGLLISLGDISLPSSIGIAAQMIGSTAAPCSLFCIGMTLAVKIIQWKQTSAATNRQNESYFVQISIIITRLLFCPLLVFVACSVLGAEHIPTVAMTIIAAMPTAIVCYVIAERHNAFVQEGIMVIVISTILSCLSIPFVISLL